MMVGSSSIGALGAFAIATALISVPADALTPPPRPEATSLSNEIANRCIGKRRDYRDFNHCWRLRAKARKAVSYCSRICR